MIQNSVQNKTAKCKIKNKKKHESQLFFKSIIENLNQQNVASKF